jgi:hypothetical protein
MKLLEVLNVQLVVGNSMELTVLNLSPQPAMTMPLAAEALDVQLVLANSVEEQALWHKSFRNIPFPLCPRPISNRYKCILDVLFCISNKYDQASNY